MEALLFDSGVFFGKLSRPKSTLMREIDAKVSFHTIVQ
jgi:hypothetical protein